MNVLDYLEIKDNDVKLKKEGKMIIKEIISEDKTDKLIEFADALGPFLKDERLSTSQIRNIFGYVKQLEYDFKEDKFLLLKPKLAYTAAKANTLGAKALREVLTASIDELRGSEDKKAKFERFVNFFEAILAYHKAAGGK